jgi:hypothetical protein
MEQSRLLKEWDTDAAVRKWKGSIALVGWQTKSGVPLVVIQDADNSIGGYTLFYKEVKYSGVIDPETKTTTEGLPYHHFESRYYPHRSLQDTWLLLMRRPNKSFKVGLNPDSHWLSVFKEELDRFLDGSGLNSAYSYKLEKPFEPMQDLKKVGAIAPRIFLGKNRVFYMNTLIGMINRKEKIISVAHQAFVQEVSDAMKGHPLWQVVSI